MAAFFKHGFQIFKLSVKEFSKPVRYLTSTLVQHVNNSSSIQLWSQEVNNFGHLRVLNGNFEVHVKGSNLYQGNQSIARVSLVPDVLGREKDFEVLTESVCCDVTNNEDESSQVTIQTDHKKMLENFNFSSLARKAKLLIEIPYFYELYLNSSSEGIALVENLESDNIDIQAENNCFLSQLKSQMISVSSKSGNILSESSLTGNLLLSTGKDGSVMLRKIQGNDLKVECEDGDVNISSIYGGDVLINTRLGNVTVGDVHGNIEVTSTTGDIICGSISGVLKAFTKDGDIEAKITLGGNIDATSLNGNALMKLDSDLKCNLKLSSKTMNIAPALRIEEISEQIADGVKTFTGQTQGAGEQYSEVKCEKGNIDLLQESWFVLPET